MKIKLDENIGTRGSKLLAERAHDVSTVRDQKLSGAPDENIFAVCAAEGRVLITLDRDFGEVLRFPPEQSAGIVILDLGREQVRAIAGPPARFSNSGGTARCSRFALDREPGRVRIHLRSD